MVGAVALGWQLRDGGIEITGIDEIVDRLNFTRRNGKFFLRLILQVVGYCGHHVAHADGVLGDVSHPRVRTHHGDVGAVQGGDTGHGPA